MLLVVTMVMKVAEDNVSETMPCGATEPSLCPGCHNHPSLKLPWRQLPEKVAASIEEFTDQLKSLWAKQIIDEGLYNKLYEFAASRYPPIFYTIRTGHHGPPLWINYHNVKSSSGFLQIGCTRCRKVTPQLWTKGCPDRINEIQNVLKWMVIIHDDLSPLPPLPPPCSTLRLVPRPPPPPPPTAGRLLPLGDSADGAAEHMIVQAPARPLPPLPWSDWQLAWSKRHTRFYWWSTVTQERTWKLPSLQGAVASDHGATTTATLARHSQAGCTDGAPDDAALRMASSREEGDIGVVERLVDPLKMSRLMQKETDTELKVECPLPNVGPLPIPGQLTGSLPFPVSPAPIPPPDGELCIHRRVWANLEREPSHLPAEPSSYELVD